MQDRFKFRVWKKLENKMVEGVTYLNPLLLDEDIAKDTAKNYVIMQCTGLKDKNGVLIFEGDIVSVLQDENPYIINYSDDRAMFTIENEAIKICCNFDNYWASELEVLGNIYHNKELLNEVGN